MPTADLLCSAHRLLTGVGAPTAPKLRGSDLLSQIETFVTLCGMVWVRAKVLGQMGWTTSPYLRAGALSCPSLAIYRAGVLRGLRPFRALPHPDATVFLMYIRVTA